MASIKEIMGMDIDDIRALGKEAGLNFHDKMKKSEMARQLAGHEASMWRNAEIASEFASYGNDHSDEVIDWVYDSDDVVHHNPFGDESAQSLSDAARVAIMLDDAGFTNTMHNAMGSSGSRNAIDTYLSQMGVSSESVKLHLPKANPDIPTKPFKVMQAYMRDTMISRQDFMTPIAGHAGEPGSPNDFIKEYATNKGNVYDSWVSLADLYVDKNAYHNFEDYEHDVNRVALKLASSSKQQLTEVAFANFNHAEHTGYIDALPQVGDSEIVKYVQHPRAPLNMAGLPLGSIAPGLEGGMDRYSLIASITGMPYNKNREIDKAILGEIKGTIKSLSSVYRSGGDNKTAVGMNPYSSIFEDKDNYSTLMDEATRSMDVEDARAAYQQLDAEIRPYTTHALNVMRQSPGEIMESETKATHDPALAARSLARPAKIETFSTNIVPQASSGQQENPSALVGNGSVQYHDSLVQGSPEWHAFRESFDITGSMVGALLGNSNYTRPWKAFTQKLGFDAPKESRDMLRGHTLEPIGRERVSKELGMQIQEVGAITNSDYPNMMYSPDGLIGDDAIWEHKAPRRFTDLHEKHQDYIDQMQLGMLLSGRKRALFSQTVGDETRSQWLDFDPDWYSKNKLKFDSAKERFDAARLAITNGEQDDYDRNSKATRNLARQALEGKGLWGDIRTKSMHHQHIDAGTARDEFLNPRSIVEDAIQDNVVTASAGNAESGMAKAVKEGLLAADEERKRKQEVKGSQSDSGRQRNDSVDSESIADSPSAGSGRRNRSSGGGGGDSGNRDLSRGGNYILNGIQSGSLGGLGNGIGNAIGALGPYGKIATTLYGAANIMGEATEYMNDYTGIAQDYGLTSGIEFSGEQQSLEMMGLSQQQAQHNAANLHSVYNRMMNSDFSGAVHITTATRGILTLEDIRRTEGDPVRLASIFRDRAKKAGWSQERAAGAAQMAGLPGFARTLNTSDELISSSLRNDKDLSDEAYTDVFRGKNAWRAEHSKTYLGPRWAARTGELSHLTDLSDKYEEITKSSYEADKYIKRSDLDARTIMLESGGDPHAVNKTSGARGLYQVLESTAKDPGYGITPIRNDSFEEYNRVGSEYLAAMSKKYNGNIDLISAAHVAGPGAVDAAYKKYGEKDWINHIGAEAKERVKKIRQLHFETDADANMFKTIKPTGTGVNNLNVSVTNVVNGRESRTTAKIKGGQSTSQTINIQGQSELPA